MKFLVAGYGSIGRRHLRNLIALGQNDIVLLRSHLSTLSEDEIKDIPVETTVEAALAHRPDGVIIANPTALHLDAAIPAAEAGCGVFMEKPVSEGERSTETEPSMPFASRMAGDSRIKAVSPFVSVKRMEPSFS